MPTIPTIQSEVCREFRVQQQHLIGFDKEANAMLARQAGMWLSVELTQESDTAIGRQFGGRDSKSVARAVLATEARIAASFDFDARLRRLKTVIALTASAPGLRRAG